MTKAVPISLPRNLHAVTRTCAAGTTIEKYSLLELSDPNTVTQHANDGGIWGGIAAMEKDGSDPSTTISVYLSGTFDIALGAGETCTVGEQLALDGTADAVRAATEAEVQLGQWIGYAEEAGSAAEVIRVRLRGQ